MQFTTFALAALSLGSAIAAPAVGLPAFNDALSAVGNVKIIVSKQVATVTTLVQGTPGADAISKVQESLLTVGQNVNGILAPIQALGNTGATPLSPAQIASVPQLVKDCQAIFAGVQTLGKTVVSGLGQNALNEVQPELQWAISTAAPITRPLISFVTTAVPGTSPVIAQVNPVLAQIQTIGNGLLAPVNGLLGGALGGVL
ncbi:hypothetical protein HD806DRAFT_76274 [Xylariaceae sp. AK1471]|nr:hypothetical protein HD806DRAFT_76274 [Xylariaceae sp. AK1471]